MLVEYLIEALLTVLEELDSEFLIPWLSIGGVGVKDRRRMSCNTAFRQ